jgi:hypothetical protein
MKNTSSIVDKSPIWSMCAIVSSAFMAFCVCRDDAECFRGDVGLGRSIDGVDDQR